MTKELYWGTKKFEGDVDTNLLTYDGKMTFGSSTILPNDDVLLNLPSVKEFGVMLTEFKIEQGKWALNPPATGTSPKQSEINIIGAGIDVLGLNRVSSSSSNSFFIGVKVSPWVKFKGMNPSFEDFTVPSYYCVIGVAAFMIGETI